MTNKLQILGFDIDIGKFPIEDIEEKSKALSKKRRTFFLKKFNSENEFLILLFHLIFVERLEKSAIARIIGYKNAANAHHLLYDLGWGDSPSDEGKNILQKAREASASLDLHAHEHVNLKLALEKVVDINKSTYQKLGFQSGEEYARVFYYLTNVEEMSPTKICHLFNLTWSMTQDRIRNLGLNKTYSKGMAGKVKRQSQDYKKSGLAGQITQRKAQYENFSPTASDKEEYFRRQISDFLYKYFDSKIYEVIVGVNNRGVIAPLEVDIPIIIYNPQQHKIFRFAIEYNGRRHTQEKDKHKQKLLEQKNWEYIEITDIPKYSNDRESLDQKIYQTCDYIKNIVDANSKNY